MTIMPNRSYPISDRRRSLYGPAKTDRHGGIEHADAFGQDIVIRPATPPPVAEYDAYLKGGNVRFCNTYYLAKKTGRRLRRIVVMRRAGATWKECGDAVGISATTAQKWVEFLPFDLAI